ncbi:S41 family peptidase [Fischerella sp. JS2]|uniref:S41 family peptidase n=1 Tax=Fischerella sp. JS2 TaxID=2597771 RepID=UPI0028EC5A59|nr:S41 family peptidase [Fischerella sp. JS2]
MKQNLLVTTAAVTLTTVVITATSSPFSKSIAQQPQSPLKQSPTQLIDEVWQIVNREYVDSTFNGQDWQAVRQQYLNRSYSSSQDAYRAIREMLQKLDDRFTRFMEPEEFKAIQVSSAEDDVGVGLQLDINEKTKEIEVISAIEDTPAINAGILPKDVLLKIDGRSTKGMSTTEAVRLLKGEPGTAVVLTVGRANKQLEFKITRQRLKLQPVRYQLQETPSSKIGYIRLTEFSANAVTEMQQAIKDLENKQVDGYILDLRSNPGGLLFSSVDIARMWINKGTIVSMVDRNGEIEREQANGKALTNKPLVAIVNEGTASGTEILAGALQENQRAILVGVKTLGYNTIQSVRWLEDGSGLAVTVAKWRTPKGRDINKSGIIPNVLVNLTQAQQQAMLQKRSFGTMADPQYSKAVEKLTQLIKKN